jgi:protein-tyrosine phosphatase
MKILFVCTGNICRSPTAHAIARHKAKILGITDIQIDSAGTSGFHHGQKPDSRSIAVGGKRGIDFEGIFSRKITRDDFAQFDLIFAMDRSHVSSLRNSCPAEFEHKIQLFLQNLDVKNHFDDEIIDPYYGENGFEEVFDLIEEGIDKLLAK